MRIEMENGRDAGLCLKLIAETPDENKILTVIDGSVVNTLHLPSGTVSLIASKPMSLKEPEPEPTLAPQP